jgi:hypothetical protein
LTGENQSLFREALGPEIGTYIKPPQLPNPPGVAVTFPVAAVPNVQARNRNIFFRVHSWSAMSVMSVAIASPLATRG